MASYTDAAEKIYQAIVEEIDYLQKQEIHDPNSILKLAEAYGNLMPRK